MLDFPIVNILGTKVHSVSMCQAVEFIGRLMDEHQPHLIATANAEMLMMASYDQELQNILNTASLVVPDGAGTVWASNKLGVPMHERVAGFDLVQELLKVAPISKRRVYFFGAAPGIAEKARQTAQEKYPGIDIVGVRDGYFTTDDIPQIIADIKATKPDLLLVALGVPKQEKWLAAHLHELGCVAIGVGGTFDVMAGVVKRAPLWMQQAKLEWAYRGLLQPSRWKRLLALPQFVMAVLKQAKKNN